MNQRLPRAERLHGRKRISELFDRGAVGRSRLVLARVLPTGDAPARMAPIVGKKTGGAVVRNRVRRRLRAAWRAIKAEMPRGWDLALIARPGVATADFDALRRDARAAVLRATEAFRARERARAAETPPESGA
jgi:ribonuclease P protein component